MIKLFFYEEVTLTTHTHENTHTHTHTYIYIYIERERERERERAREREREREREKFKTRFIFKLCEDKSSYTEFSVKRFYVSQLYFQADWHKSLDSIFKMNSCEVFQKSLTVIDDYWNCFIPILFLFLSLSLSLILFFFLSIWERNTKTERKTDRRRHTNIHTYKVI